jgi:hypothetical protein
MTESFKSPDELYQTMRSQDPELGAREQRARAKILALTGYRAEDVGSFGLLLNLPGSDLDLPCQCFSPGANQTTSPT